MYRAVLILITVMVAVTACEVGPTRGMSYFLARTTTPDGRFWQVYHRGEWRDIGVDGLRPPTSLSPEVLTADNWFMFIGTVDTLELRGITRRELPTITLLAWKILWPVQRVDRMGEPLQTERPSYPVAEDFEDLSAYQRYSVNTASHWWPHLVDIEYPEEELYERPYTLRRRVDDPETNPGAIRPEAVSPLSEPDTAAYPNTSPSSAR